MMRSNRFKDNEKFVLEAMQSQFIAIDYASERLKNDRNFILSAVKLKGHALVHVLPKFQNDKEIVLTAVENGNFNTFKYASDELKNDKDFVLQVLKISPYSFQYVSDKLKEDKAVIKQALTLEGRNLQFLPENLRDDTNLASMAVKQNVDAFQYASKRLRANKDFVLDSVHQANPNTIDSVAIYANKETLTDTEIASIIAETNKSKLAKILKNNQATATQEL